MLDRITAPDEVIGELVRIAHQAYPEEGCAVIVGRAAGDHLILERVFAADNVTPDDPRRKFRIDPEILLRSQKAARRSKHGVAVFFHSHPDHPATPSEHDRKAAWPGAVHLIASAGRDRVFDVAAFELDGSGSFVPVSLEIETRSAKMGALT
ncbi:MAG TPA: M67 family metallopeptidase [Thermoanaerobaculia bacterium]|nr:M67 family metallopeptidase [Thermoanaerobaculia bacterium]